MPEDAGEETLRRSPSSGGAGPSAVLEGSTEVCKSNQEGVDCSESGLPNSDVVIPRVVDKDTADEGEAVPDSLGHLSTLSGSVDSSSELISSPTCSTEDTQVVPVAPESGKEDEVAGLPFSDSPILPIDTSSLESHR